MDLIIAGAGGFGREIVDVVDSVEGDVLVGFVDDGQPDSELLERMGVALLGPSSELARRRAHYLIGVGSPSTRRTIDERLLEHGAVARPALVHKTAAIGRLVELGDGTVVCAQAVLTSNIRVGRHVHVNLGTTIGHDCVIGDYVTLAPGVHISGNVVIHDGVEFGSGSVVIPGVEIGEGSIIGAGAVVTKNIPANVTAVGMPARPLPRSE